MRSGGERLRERMAHRGASRAGHRRRGRAAGRPRERHDRGRRQAPAAAAGRARRRGRRRSEPAEPRRGSERCVRAAVAVELVHSATLVHDDVIDGAPLRRGRPTVAAAAGREAAIATGDLLFSRAFAELARNGDRASCRRSRTRARRWPRASCCSARTPTRRGRGRALSAPLRAEDGRAVRGRLPAGRARRAGRPGRRATRRCARRVCAAHRPGLPAARRRAGRLRPGRAHRQATRHGPARRHRHAAVDPRARARRRAGRLRPARCAAGPEQAEELCERIAATGALDEAREQALALVAEAKAALPASLPAAAARTLLDAGRHDAVVERYR